MEGTLNGPLGLAWLGLSRVVGSMRYGRLCLRFFYKKGSFKKSVMNLNPFLFQTCPFLRTAYSTACLPTLQKSVYQTWPRLCTWFFLLGFLLGAVPYLALAAQPFPATQSAIQIRLFNHAKVAGPNYTLGEIAEIGGADLRLANQLQTASLGRSPKPGSEARLSSIILRRKIQRIAPGVAIDLKIPQQVIIQRAYQSIGGDEIAARAVQYLQATSLNKAPTKAKAKRMHNVRYANPVGRAAIKSINPGKAFKAHTRMWEAVSIPSTARLPLGRLTWQFYAPQRVQARNSIQIVRVGVTILVNGKRAFSTGVGLQQKQVFHTTTVKHPIAAGEVLQAKDLERVILLAEHPPTNLNQMVGPQKAVGRKALRTILPGQQVRRAWLASVKQPLKAGQRVTLSYRKPGVRFTSLGVSLAGGKLGAFIPVRNLQSGKVVYGIVEAGQVVRVN